MKKNSEFVGVDDKFIPEDEKYVDESILGNKQEARKTIKKIGIGYLCYVAIIFVLVITMIIFIFSTFFKIFDKASKQIGTAQSQMETNKDTVEAKVFNNNFEMYSGTVNKNFVTILLDKVIVNNKNQKDHIILVTYNAITTIDTDEITEMKKSFEDGRQYEVSLDYSDSGFVNKVTIRNI